MGCRSLHVDVQMSGWWAVRPAKEDWKSKSPEFGEQSVIITSTTAMLELPAIVLDSGRCCCCCRFFSLQVHRVMCQY